VAFGALAMLRAASLSSALGWGGSAVLVALVASSPYLLYWCFGSLETTMAAWLTVEIAILAGALVEGRRGPLSPITVGLTAAYLMVRPEAAFVLTSALAVWVGLLRAVGTGADRSAIRVGSRWLVLAGVLFAGLCLFRWSYFGQLFPQPVMTKVGGDVWTRWVDGLDFYRKLIYPPLGIVMAAALVSLPWLIVRELGAGRRKSTRLFVLLFAGASAAFALFSGGDWMRGGRFFTHFQPVALVALYGFLSQLSPRRLSVALIAACLAINAAGVVGFAMWRNSGRPLWAFLEKDWIIRSYGAEFQWPERANKIHTRDILFIPEISRIIEKLLEQQETVSVMSGQAGMVAYYLAKRFDGRVEFIDRWGLATRHFMPAKRELDLQTTQFGLNFPVSLFLAEARSRTEPFWHPDVIFDFNETARPLIEANGYRTVYEQSGNAVGYLEQPGTPLYPIFGAEGLLVSGYTVTMYHYAAVRDELAGPFGEHPRSFDWNRARASRLGIGLH
ncbi:MAG: hypothetical protein ABFS46_19800, partial [Myxococcota bacterium]